MDRETEIALIERLLAHHEAGTTPAADDEARIPLEVYRSPTRFARERKVLFRERPILIAHASELAAAGDYLTNDALGLPIVVVRDREGVLRAFLNVCRHRGARIATDERGHDKKAFVCGYHGWSYRLDGALLHMPHADGFPRTGCDRDLVPLPVVERAGFIFVVATPGPSHHEEFLGPLAAEIDGFRLADHVALRTESVRRRFHWKLIIDAFLDGYHLRVLHRASVARFFLDNLNLADPFGPHIRSVVARKPLESARSLPRESWSCRELVSLTYFLFPNTVLVFHPDWVSRITLFPVDENETVFTHTMLVPPGSATDEKRAHWDKTWSLIHGTVFEREDMVAAEWIQGGMDAGANTELTLGRYEFPIRWFHDSIEKALDGKD